MLIQIKDQDIENAKHSNFLDDMETLRSPNGGHIVCCAVKSGVYVCWQCGEPFDPSVPGLSELEKRVGGPVPLYVHRKCWNGPVKKPFSFIAKGLQVRRAVAEIVKKTIGIAEAAAGTDEKKIVL